MDKLDLQICYSRPSTKRQQTNVINISRMKSKIVRYESDMPQFVQEFKPVNTEMNLDIPEPTEE